jgi:OmpA-OmpF porin, OOP family
MAKTCLLIIALFTVVMSSFAQIKIGITGGPQTSSINEKNTVAGWDSTTGRFNKSKSGIHLGLTAEIPLGGIVYFQPSVLYTEKGRSFSKILDTMSPDSSFYSYNTTQNLNIQYIDIPLHFGIKLPLSRRKTSSFLLNAGPYFSLFYNGKNTLNQNDQVSTRTETNTTRVNKTTVLEVGKKEDSYRTFGYGISGRAGIEIGNITLTGFYSQGLDNLYYSPYGGTFNHKVVGGSLGIWLGRIAEPVVIKDKDKDGVIDSKDACPLLPGAAITNGCPDKDADGIADKDDKCADIAGLVKYNGCPVPDTDNDGVNDEADKCPSVAGTAQYNGCPVPDTDNDGINDEADKCPAVAGSSKYNGCPVSDTDKDGVDDEADKCPEAAGTAANNGCPVIIKEEIKQQVAFAAEKIFFAVNSATLLSKSYQALDTVVAVLNNNPGLKISVDGYTDNTGTEAANQAISNKRANAVKAYLVKKGIDETRITAAGHGPASPVADNSSAEGRSKNRRVELGLQP